MRYPTEEQRWCRISHGGDGGNILRLDSIWRSSAIDFFGISLEDNGELTSFGFDPRHGIPEQTTNAAYTELTHTCSNTAGAELTAFVYSVGRMRLCSDNNAEF